MEKDRKNSLPLVFFCQEGENGIFFKKDLSKNRAVVGWFDCRTVGGFRFLEMSRHVASSQNPLT